MHVVTHTLIRAAILLTCHKVCTCMQCPWCELERTCMWDLIKCTRAAGAETPSQHPPQPTYVERVPTTSSLRAKHCTLTWCQRHTRAVCVKRSPTKQCTLTWGQRHTYAVCINCVPTKQCILTWGRRHACELWPS